MRSRSLAVQPNVLTLNLRYRKYKGWVKLILIRRVDDIAAVGIEDKNKPERFEKAFMHVPKDVWHVFDDPQECYKIINDVVGRAS